MVLHRLEILLEEGVQDPVGFSSKLGGAPYNKHNTNPIPVGGKCRGQRDPRKHRVMIGWP